MLSLFIMGLGMGGTMMPIMSSALATLRDHTIARGSTLMNIVQQVSASIGTAVFTVLLTNGLQDTISATTPPAEIPSLTASVYGDVFLVGAVMVALVLIPAFFLPRKKVEHQVDPALLVGH
jgi:MFS family permease